MNPKLPQLTLAVAWSGCLGGVSPPCRLEDFSDVVG